MTDYEQLSRDETTEDDHWFRVGTLPEICMLLHMQHTGVSDPWLEDKVGSCCRYLHRRLRSWRPGLARYEYFDFAVKLLVITTLAEVER